MLTSYYLSVIFAIFAPLVAPQALKNGEYTKMQWTDCGSKGVQVLEFDISPMPIVQPGNATLNFRAVFRRPLVGELKTDINILRTGCFFYLENL